MQWEYGTHRTVDLSQDSWRTRSEVHLRKLPREPPRTITRRGRRPQHLRQWLRWSTQSLHPRQSPLPPPLSILQALMGRPLPSIKVQTVKYTSRGCFKKYLCSLLKSSTQTNYTQEQIPKLESWTLQISAGPCRRRKIQRHWPTISIRGYHHYRGDYSRSY